MFDIEPAKSTNKAIITMQISNMEFAEFMENFTLGDDMYLKRYRPYFDSDLQKRVDQVRDPVITWIHEARRVVEKASMEKRDPDLPSFMPILGNVVSYLNLLTDTTDEQIKRIRV